MDVKNCRQCGRLYNYIGGSYRNLCPDCISKLEDKFQEVKDYIEAHTGASIHEISTDCEVSSKQIEQWIREDRLTFADDSPIGIPCEACGVTIKSGRFCENCKSTMTQKLNSMYQSPSSDTTVKTDRSNPRMRFLDK
ncbi:MAG: flagellar protein [Eubacteriales bacterium]|nr:flagellar protein [Eubacteriales bacterium]